MEELAGIVVSHVYFFLTEFAPDQMNGRRLISTPAILRYYFPGTHCHEAIPLPSLIHSLTGPQAAVQRPGQGPRQVGYNWGRGNVLNQ